jgi:formyltetrahydrofolate deformylase
MTRPSKTADDFVLVVKCPDRKGVVAAVSSFLADNAASIVESNHFNDATADEFYMRTVFRADGPMPGQTDLERGFELIARRFDMHWSLHAAMQKPRVMIAVSKFGHCLYDLLHRWRRGSCRWRSSAWSPTTTPCARSWSGTACPSTFCP